MGRSEPGSQSTIASLPRPEEQVGCCHLWSVHIGVGRENMKKIHVEEILQGKNNRGIYPGSGTYEPISTFGSSNKYNIGYSMRKNLYMDDLKY